MGFAKGPITFRRFFIIGPHAKGDAPQRHEALAAHAFGRHVETAEDHAIGWIVPTHLFDVDFASPERYRIGRYMYLAMRVDRLAPPRAVVASYRAMEAAAALRATGRDALTRAELRTAKDAAEQRAARETREGVHRRITAYPVLIDWEDAVVYFGHLGAASADRLCALFAETFDVGLVAATVGETAMRFAERHSLLRSLDAAEPMLWGEAAHGGGVEAGDTLDRTRRAFLGSEFLVWLWRLLDTGDGALPAPRGANCDGTIEGLVQLDCPAGRTGRTTVRCDAPPSAPECRAALRLGKMPTRVTIRLSSAEGERTCSVNGPAWTISGLCLAPTESSHATEILEERFDGLRAVWRLWDHLFGVFLRARLGPSWEAEAAGVAHWARGAVEPATRRVSA
jgi:hypothetical protein